MQQLDALTLKHLAVEWQRLLVGGRVNKVQQPTRHEIVLSWWWPKESAPGSQSPESLPTRLYIHLQPQLPMLFLAYADELEPLITPTLTKPTGFTMLLRKHLQQATLRDITCLPGERVLHWTFSQVNEFGEPVRLVLSIELMGKTTNLILFDDETQTILGAAHSVLSDQSRLREVAAGYRYVPPPKPVNKTLWDSTSSEAITTWLSAEATADSQSERLKRWTRLMTERFMGFSTGIVEPMLWHAADPADAQARLASLWDGQALVRYVQDEQSKFCLLLSGDEPPAPSRSASSWMALLHDYGLARISELKQKQMRQDLQQVLSLQQRRLLARRDELSREETDDAESYEHLGHLLMNAHNAGQAGEPGTSSLAVDDYVSGESRTVAIDPMVSLLENARRYYRQSRKVKARQIAYQHAIEELDCRQSYLDELAQWLAQAESVSELVAIREDMSEAGWMKPLTEPSAKGGKGQKGSSKPVSDAHVVRYQSDDGFVILVGKSGQGNDRLVGKLAKPDDIWFHAHLMPGSHVILKTEKQTPSDTALLKAAELTAWYSAGRHATQVPVIHTQCRYVRKIPNSYPGHVNYRQERTIIISTHTSMNTQSNLSSR